jgi:4-amino-4-deoxy-L-arabinose transferase-like glycosyltransferase
MTTFTKAFDSGPLPASKQSHEYRWLAVIVLGAFFIRAIVAVAAIGMEPSIVDEQHYLTLAANVAEGNGFGWDANTPTSIRPPLYPFFIAGVWTLTGASNPQTVRWAQIPLALLSILLLYLLGRRWFDGRTALVASASLALYPGLLFSGVLILTETLFVMLLLLFLLAVAHVERRATIPVAAVAGAALGLAALARSILWPFIVVLTIMMWWWAGRARVRRLPLIAGLLVGYAIVIGPWAIRNTQLQRTVTVVDTMGGLNLLMGNYAYTPEDRMWDAVSLSGPRAWSANLPSAAPDGRPWTEGTKEKWARQEAITFMVAHPFTTLRRAALKFSDFWGLEREFVAGVERGYFRPPPWLFVVVAVAGTVAYVATAVLGVIGICLSPPRMGPHVLLVSVIAFTCAVHTVIFGHSRYHLPLVPILLLYGVSAVTSGAYRQLFRLQLRSVVALASIGLLSLIWAHEVLGRDWDRIRQLVGPF